jgi:hypothetical protein
MAIGRNVDLSAGAAVVSTTRICRSRARCRGARAVYEDFIEPTSATVITYVYRGNARTAFTKQADGTFTNTSIPAFRGTTITVNADGGVPFLARQHCATFWPDSRWALL